MANGLTGVGSTDAGAREERLATLERVLSSAQFRGASRLQQFLSYIVDRTLEGDLESLREARIGVDLFGRGEQFDPSADSIVRTQASLLRKRLAEYYTGPGQHDSIRIDLPRGGYVARFLPAVAAPVVVDPLVPPPAIVKQTFRFQAQHWVMALLGAAVGILGTLLVMSSNKAASPNYSRLPIWSTFMQKVDGATVAVGAPYFLDIGDGKYFRDVRVNDETEHGKSEQFELFTRTAPQAKAGPSVYTGFGEALGLRRLTRTFDQNRWRMRVVRGDQLRWQDLKDENVIILGSFRFKTIETELDPFSHFEFDATSPFGFIRNLHPRPGELTEYRSTMDWDRGKSYALVTLLPGKTPGRRILLLHGLHTWGTQAAAEFVTSEEHLTGLRQRMSELSTGGQAPEFFQILLRAELRHHQPLEVEVEALRKLTAK